MKNQLVFISGPYRADTLHGVVENIRRAEQAAIECWKRGYTVFCPHKNTSLLDGVLPDEVWLAGDIEILRRCDVLVQIDGWENSKGAEVEYQVAFLVGIEIKSMKEIMNEPVLY